MDKTIEQKYFKQFDVVDDCFDWMEQQYDLGFKSDEEHAKKPQKPLSDKQKHYHDVVLPRQINEAVAAFDNSVLPFFGKPFDNMPLMQEIASNLDECKDAKQTEHYIFYLLTPFKRFSDKLTPIAKINQLKGDVPHVIGIKQQQQELSKLQQMPPSETTKEQAEACKKKIGCWTWQIQRLEKVAAKYQHLLFEHYDGAKWKQKGTVERNLSFLCFTALFIYGNALDALLLKRGLDLLLYQRQCGIYLIKCHDVKVLSEYLGSVEIATRYIDEALSKMPDAQEATPEQPTASASQKPQPEAGQEQQPVLPKELDTDEAKAILSKAIALGLCDACYNWQGTKQTLAYFADMTSHILGLSNTQIERDGEMVYTTNWKPFEALFTCKGKRLGQDKLSDAKQNWMRLNTKFEPNGFEAVKKVFE